MDLIKDLWCTILKFLTRNDSYAKKLATVRKVLSLAPARTRFILAMVAQAHWGHRSYYRRIKNGSVKGVWYAKNASTRSEAQLAGGNGPVIMFIHGGAFVVGQCKMWSEWAVALVDAHNKKYGKDLRWHECRAAVDYLTRTMSVDPSRLFIAGDSAGGNLALQTMYELENAQKLAGSILFSPFVLPAMTLVTMGLAEDKANIAPAADSTWHTMTKNDYITDVFGQEGVKAYIGNSMSYEAAYSSSQINPGLRTPREVEQLPGILLIYGEGERLRDQIAQWAEKVKVSAKDIQIFSQPGAVHDWPLNPDYSRDPADFHKAIDMVSTFVENQAT